MVIGHNIYLYIHEFVLPSALVREISYGRGLEATQRLVAVQNDQISDCKC